MSYKLGSLFDGSGGFPLSGALCGVEPVWAAEVEPYPIAVTRSRFPNMKHLGDISKVHGGEIEPVDIITFGSPCQDLSVAGKRAGLKHEANGDEETTRSGLFMEAVRIIKEMRSATNGKYPRFALWENVPGAFSSNKGEDFRIVCEELIKIVEPAAFMPSVPKGGWAYADSYVGDGWSLAYRVFDAQHWGVPQRRRRIHLVADFSGQCAREVLFEREGVRGYFTEGRTPWQATPADAQGSTGADDCEGEMGDRAVHRGGDGCGRGGRQLDAVTDVILDDQGGQQISVRTDGQAPTLRAETHGNLPCVMEAVGFDVYNQAVTGDVAKSLTAVKSDADHTPVVAVPYTLKIRSGCEGGGKGALVQKDKSATLATNNDQYLFQPMSIENNPADSRVNIDDSGKVQTLTSRMGTGGGNVPMVMEPTPVICLQGNGIDRADTAGCNGRGWNDETCYTLNTIDRPAVVYGFDRAAFNQGQNAKYDFEVSDSGVNSTLVARGPSGVAYETPVRYIVRRLTPTECARLQGFADWWGIVEPKDSLTDEEYQFWLEVRNTHAAINGKKVQDYTKKQMLTWYNKLWTDSSEYKMWGNGIALPPALYCLQGIVDALNKPEEDDDSWLM